MGRARWLLNRWFWCLPSLAARPVLARRVAVFVRRQRHGRSLRRAGLACVAILWVLGQMHDKRQTYCSLWRAAASRGQCDQLTLANFVNLLSNSRSLFGGTAPTEYSIRLRCPILLISRTACSSISHMRLMRSISAYRCFLFGTNNY